MIRSDKGTVVIKGSKPDVLTDLSVIAHSLKSALVDGGMKLDDAEGLIIKSVKVGFEDVEEDECAENKDAIDEAVDRLFDAILHNAAKGE